MSEGYAEGWHCVEYGGTSGEHQIGPLTWEELYARASSGALQPFDGVWHPELPGWMRAEQVPGLFPAGAETPPSMETPAAGLIGVEATAVWPGEAQPVPRGGIPLLAWLIPLITLVLVGAGIGTYFGLTRGDGRDAAITPGGGSTIESPVVGETDDDTPDLGVAECKALDPAKLVQTPDWGLVPANRVCVVLAEGSSEEDAKAVAEALGGEVVGRIEFTGLYEIETAGVTEAELRAAVDQARALPGVQSAMANVELVLDTEIWGVRQSPMNDPVYANGRDGGYNLIGAPKAWTYIKGSGLPVSQVHSGFADSGVWKGSGDFDGDTQVYFPDQSAGELYEPNQVLNDNGESTEKPTGSHGTMTMGQFCGDPGNGGTAGLASTPLGSDLTVSHVNIAAPPYGVTQGEVVAPDPNNPSVVPWSDGNCYSLGGLKALLTLVESGAKVINCSWSSRPDTESPEWAQAYQQFFEKMSVEHPDVLFVCSAGNRGQTEPYKDGAVTWPGGRKLPNMITVGNVLNDGTMWETSNRQNDAPDHEYEVTLAAPGHEAIQGLDEDGTPLQAGITTSNGLTMTGGGTSAAAPMVAAAATLLIALDPDLTAAEIKQILSDTARPGPAELGGKIVAMDLAVLEVINRQREDRGLPRVTGEELEKGGVIDAVAISQEDEPDTWMVKAIVESVPSVDGAEITITATTGTKIEGELTQKITAPGEVVWIPVTVPNEAAEITITRGDNGASSVITFEQIDINGMWTGTLTFTSFSIDPETAPTEGEEGCSLAFGAALMEKLLNVPIPLSIDITAYEDGTGTSTWVIELDEVLRQMDTEGQMEVGEMEPITMTLVYADKRITFTPVDTSGDAVSVSATVSQSGDTYRIDGTFSTSGNGSNSTAAFSVTWQG